MLERLTLDNFTVFEHAEFEFGMLNVFHGENGTGKTHVLKMLYAVHYAAFESDYDPWASGAIIPEMMPSRLGEDIEQVYKAPTLASLVRDGAAPARIAVVGNDKGGRFQCAFTVDPEGQGTVAIAGTSRNVFEYPANYLPPTPLIHLKSGFALFFDQYHSDFERTWRDLVINLRAPLPKQLDPAMQAAAEQLAKESGLEYYVDPGENFYVSVGGGKFSYASLAAEGHRKLVTLLVLLRNGRIRPGSQLFFDEPEANLNPALLKVAAKAIVMLAQAGVQVFIATHSLFLMREIQVILVDSPETAAKTRYFGLHRTEAGVRVDDGPDPADTGDIAALDANLEQSARYMALQESL